MCATFDLCLKCYRHRDKIHVADHEFEARGPYQVGGMEKEDGYSEHGKLLVMEDFFKCVVPQNPYLHVPIPKWSPTFKLASRSFPKQTPIFVHLRRFIRWRIYSPASRA